MLPSASSPIDVPLPNRWLSPFINYDPPPQTLEMVKLSNIKTQKARGYKQLGMRSLGDLIKPYLGNAYILPQNIKYLEGHPGRLKGTWFARPCPVTPRHGFVESRDIGSYVEALAVFEEARKEDPEAEVLLVPKLSGKYSGVATNMGVTWGMGNDGVTGSKGNTFLIPTPPSEPKVWNSLYEFWGYSDIKEVGYVELVENGGGISAVQFRDGPQLPATRDYIPKKVKVKEVLWEMSDLLEWERTIKSKRNTKGLVVQLKKGTALSAHAAVHAIALGIPAVGSHHVEVGETLVPGEDQPKQLSAADYSQLRAKMKDWELFIGQEKIPSILTAVASVHAMSVWDNSPHLLTLRAFAIPTLIRFLSSASHGELRHWWTNGPGGHVNDNPTTPFESEISEYSGMRGLGRRQVYDEVFRYPFLKLKTNLETLVIDYSHKEWGNRRKAYHNMTEKRKRQWRKTHRKQYAYGGPKWAEVASTTLTLLNAYLAFQDTPNATTWGEVIIAANNAIHTAHNGGFALSKWLQDADFHNIAQSPGWGFTNIVAATLVLGKRNQYGAL